jgi:hypothetical protein
MQWPWSKKSVTTSSPTPASGRRFIGVDDVASVLWGTDGQSLEVLYAPPMPRELALTIPTYLRAHAIIAAGIGQLPLNLTYEETGEPAPWRWISREPEPGIVPAVTMSRLVSDLIDYEHGWLWTVGTSYERGNTYRRLDASSVPVMPNLVTTPYGTYEEWPEVAGLVRFDSPTFGLLKYGRRALWALARLESSALSIATGQPPVDWFEVTDGFNMDEEEGSAENPDHPEWSEIDEFLYIWREARKKGTTAYIPNGLAYKQSGFNPEQLQLGAARQHAVAEISRLTGIDPEDLALPISSRSYFNAQDRRRHRTDFVLGPFMTAIQQRISRDDVTPRGQVAAFDLGAFLRPDDLTAAQVDQTLIASKILTIDEVRERRRLRPLGTPPADPEEPVTNSRPLRAIG